MVQIYTKDFHVFQKEVEQSNFYIFSKSLDSVDAKVYGVKQFEPGKTFERQHLLTYFTNSDFITCRCGMFEFKGYPCRHILSYLKKKKICFYWRNAFYKDGRRMPRLGQLMNLWEGHLLMMIIGSQE